jgi:hypothetical protein
MLKIWMRIGLILLVAGVVAGGWYWFAGNSSSSLGSLPGGGEQHAKPALAAGRTAPAGGFQGARGGGDRENQASGELGGLATQLGKVALITLGVVGVQWVGGKLIRRRRMRSPQPA